MADDEAETRGPTRRRTTAAAGGPSKVGAAAAKKAATRSATTRKAAPDPAAPAGKSAAKGSVVQPAAKKPAPRKAITRRTGATLASGSKADEVAPPTPAASRLAAEQTFDDDDWDPPTSTRPATDPSARIRAALRSAAAELRAREAGSGAIAGYPVVSPEPVVSVGSAEPVVPAEPTDTVTEIVIGPARRGQSRRATKWAPVPEPEPEPEWTAEDQPVDEEPTVDRIPDATDVLSLPEVAPSPPPRTSTRRFPPPPPPAAPAATPPPTPPAADTAPPPVEPPTWTPPPESPKDRKSGGAGLSVLAIVLSIVVPVIGAIVGFVLATRARRRGLALATLARVVAVVALVVWLAAGTVALVAARDQGIDYSKLKVGDCFDSAATNEVRGIDVKSCSKDHNSEVFFLVSHPAGPDEPYPGKDALVQFAADACLGAPLTEYLGIPLAQSTLKDFEIVPQESAWKDGRRLLVCGIDTGGQGRISGSVKGTSR